MAANEVLEWFGEGANQEQPISSPPLLNPPAVSAPAPLSMNPYTSLMSGRQMLKELVDKSSEIDQAILIRFPPFLVEQIHSLPHENLNLKICPLNDIEMRFFRYF